MRELSDAVVQSAQEIEQEVQAPASQVKPGSQLPADQKKFPTD